MAGEGLTEKQKKFAERYAGNGGNGTEAAEFAGYAKPAEQASENLRKPNIANYIRGLTANEKNGRIADARERQEFFTSAMRGELLDMKGNDRIKAAELLGKMQGDFIERHQVTADISVNSTVEEIDKTITELNERLGIKDSTDKGIRD